MKYVFLKKGWRDFFSTMLKFSFFAGESDSIVWKLKSLFKYSGFTLLLSLLTVSCIRPPEKRLAQTLQGTVAPVSQLTSLKCLLTTGAAREERVNWTEAQVVNLQRKSSSDQYEKIQPGETVKYNSGVSSKEGEDSKGYINYFSYVPVVQVKTSYQSGSKKPSKQLNYKVSEDDLQARKVKSRLTCENLLQPEDIPFLIAKPHYNYVVRFQVVGDKVRALLLAPAEDLPSQALAYSYKVIDKGDQEFYAMPFGGYKVQPGYIEQRESADWEATNVLIFRKIPIRKRAKYQTQPTGGIPSSWPTYHQADAPKSPTLVQIQFNSGFQPFKTLAERGGKKDVYAKSFFSGDWYYTNTFITNSMSSHPNLPPGISFSLDNQFRKSHKIRLQFEDKSLVAYSLNKETSGEENSLSTSDDRWVFRVPVKHLDYRTSAPLGDLDAGLEEIPDDTKRDREKSYFQAGLSQIKLSVGNFPEYQLHEITMSEDYFSFVLRSEVNQYQVRFSFLRAVPKEESAYNPLILSKASKNFPVFFQRKRVDPRERYIRSKKFQESFPVNRFHLDKPIVYRFSTLTPDDPLVRNIGREMIAVWAQIFEKAGVLCSGGPCVTLLSERESDVELGDIRYNILNLISPDDLRGPNFLNGFGPSVADFKTGEIISTTSNVYLNKMHTSIIWDIYHYLQSRSGLILPLSERNAVRRASVIPSRGQQSFSMGGEGILSFVPQFLRHWDPNMWSYSFRSVEPMNLVPFSDVVLTTAEDGVETVKFLFSEEDSSTETQDESLDPFHKISISGAPSCELQAADGFLPARLRYHLIDVLCGEHLTLIKTIKSAGITGQSPHKKRNWFWEKSKMENYKTEIYQCADKVLRIVGLSTGLHEVGHNMSMMHNFAASADKENFLPVDSFHYSYTFKSDEQKDKVLSLLPSEGVTASVMEYMPSPEMRIVPGKYDIDFIRFLYTEEMETDTGQSVKVSVNDGGDVQYMTAEGETVHQREIRRYRACWEKDVKESADIYCNRWDRGTTPSEIVEYHRAYLKDTVNLLGSSISPFPYVLGDGIRRFFRNTVKIYHKWRVELSKKLVDISDPLYLKDITAEEYNNQLISLLCEHGLGNSTNGIIACEYGFVDQELSELYKARSMIYDTFLIHLFNIRDHYCVLRDMSKEGMEEWVAFRDIHQYITEEDRLDLKKNFSEISSCDDVKDLFPRNLKKYIGEVGMPLFPGVFSTDQNNNFEFHRTVLEGAKSDYSGSIRGRLLSGFAFFLYSWSPVLKARKKVSLMNEPDIRDKIFQTLTSRLFKGIPIAQAQRGKNTETFYQPVFSNEELLWSILSLPIFMNYNHPSNDLDAISNRIGAIVIVKPVNLSQSNGIELDFLETKRVFAYDDIRREKGYLIYENKELYHRSRPLVILNESRSPHLTALIQALRAIDLRWSFLHFTEKINQENKKDSFQNKKDKVESYLENLKSAAKTLYSDPSLFVNVLTFSLLYDFLELGEKGITISSRKTLPNDGEVTSWLVEQLQIVRVWNFKINKASHQKCKEFGREDCPDPVLGLYKGLNQTKEQHGEFQKIINKEANRTYELKQKMDSALVQGQTIPTINIFKPVLESLKESLSVFVSRENQFESLKNGLGESLSAVVPGECGEISLTECLKELMPYLSLNDQKDIFHLMQELYFMELFRSDMYSSSSVRQSLRELLSYLMEKASLSEEEKTASRKRISAVTEGISQLRTLKQHRNSKLFQEIFIRNMLFYSWKNVWRKNSKDVFDTVPKSVINGMISILEIATVLPVSLGEAEQKAKERRQRVPVLYSSLLIQEPLLSDIQEFQSQVSGILDKSFNEVLDAMRIAPADSYDLFKGLRPFLSMSDLNDYAPLYGVFNGRMSKELEAQKNIIIEAIRPYLILGREEGLVK
ncbi:MAG: hypothetical protein OXB86_03385 [Bdellovibrionales bacterium]|nr:hypothetical protein [Bdellovibrionales bacterium]